MSSNLSNLSSSFENVPEASYTDENCETIGSSLNLRDYEMASNSNDSGEEVDTLEYEASDHTDLHSDTDEEKSYSKEPLFPKLIYDIKGAVNNFGKVFNARYGTNHAPFFAGSLEEAIEESFVAPGRPESDRKPLAIYLHSDDKAASASNVFPEKILCSEKVSSLLSKQYVTWPFDMTLVDHQEVFYELISNTVCAEIKDEIQRIPTAKYPLLVIVVQEKSPAFACIFVQGHDTESEALENLLIGLDHFAANINRTNKDTLEIKERKRLLNVWLKTQRKRNYCNSKDDNDVSTEVDYLSTFLAPIEHFSDYRIPAETETNFGKTSYQFSVPSYLPALPPTSGSSVAPAHTGFKKRKMTSITLPETADVEGFTDLSNDVYRFSVDIDSCFAFEFSLLREKRVAKNLKIVSENLSNNEIGLLLEYCISVRRLLNLFQCAPDLSSASLSIHFELTEKAQAEVQQLIVENEAEILEDGQDVFFLQGKNSHTRLDRTFWRGTQHHQGLGSKEDRVLANRFGIQLRQRDLDKLKPGQCLNDDVINYYLQLVAERNRGKAFALSSLSTHNISQSTAQTKKPVPFDFCDDGNILWTFIPDGNNVAIKKIDRSRRTSCANEHLLQGHFQSVTAIAYRRNRQELITSANDRLALIWTPKMDEERPEYEQKAVDLHKDEYSDED
uniref:UAS domain-containing protein n=1 Tax=Ditylenchus dipsaci TaxID=166011 RepID=A0A915CRA5_9BILA